MPRTEPIEGGCWNACCEPVFLCGSQDLPDRLYIVISEYSNCPGLRGNPIIFPVDRIPPNPEYPQLRMWTDGQDPAQIFVRMDGSLPPNDCVEIVYPAGPELECARITGPANPGPPYFRVIAFPIQCDYCYPSPVFNHEVLWELFP